MIKRVVSILLLFIILFTSVSIINVNAEEKVKECSIEINFGSIMLSRNVLKNQDGTILVPVTWIEYFGGMSHSIEGGYHKFSYIGQEELGDFAKRIVISEDGKTFDIRYYMEEPEQSALNAKFNGFANSIRQKLFEISKEKKNAIKFAGEEVYSYSILSGTFSQQSFYKENLYLPIEEVLPFLNADIVFSKEGIVFINPHAFSISQALYRQDINSMSFDAERDITCGKELGWGAYVLDSFLTTRLDRLDFICNSGQINDYQELFKSYLTDNEAYLSAYDQEKTPEMKQYELVGKILGQEKSALTLLQSGPKWMQAIGYSDDAIAETFPTLYPIFYEKFPFGSSTVNGAKIVSGFNKSFSYLNTYANQVEDHRRMLSAVFNHNATESSKKSPAYKAAVLTEAKYGKDHASRAIGIAASGTIDAIWDFAKTAVEKETLGTAFLPFKITSAILQVGLKNEFKVVKNTGLINHMDAVVQKANCVFSDGYGVDFSTSELDNLRLSAIMSLIASRHAYTSLWDKNHEKIKDIDALLTKLYLAADGVECDSSDYYGKKKAELKKELKKIKTTDGWSDNEGPINSAPANITDYLGMTVDEIAAIWGEDYNTSPIQHGVFVMYYEDNRTPLQFNYVFAESSTARSIFEITIGKEDTSIIVIDNLTNRETYSSIKKQYPKAKLGPDEDVFMTYTMCRLVINGFSIEYIWNKSNPDSEVADYVSIKKYSSSSDQSQENTGENAPSTLTDYLGMTVDEIAAIWGEDYKTGVNIYFGAFLYYDDNRIPVELYLDYSLPQGTFNDPLGEYEDLNLPLSGNESVNGIISKNNTIPVLKGLNSKETLIKIKQILGNGGNYVNSNMSGELEGYQVTKNGITYRYVWINNGDLAKEHMNKVPSEWCYLHIV